MAAGKLNQEGRSGSLGAGAAAGATAAAVGAGTAVVIGPGLGAFAVASATVVLLPFAVVGRAWGMAKMKRAHKEAAIKKVISGCLQERGYSVAGWEMVTKKRRTAAAVATNAIQRPFVITNLRFAENPRKGHRMFTAAPPAPKICLIWRVWNSDDSS